jgi:hypothetical protein
MLKKNKNIEWTSQGPIKKFKMNEQFENTASPSFKGVKLWLDASQLVGKDGQQIQLWQSVPNVISGGGTGISDLKSPDNKVHWPIVKENSLNKLPVVEFAPAHQMSNTINIALANFTMAFVSRQMDGGVNRRLFIGNGNRAYGYWEGRKNVYLSESWIIHPDQNPAALRSNDEWDLFIIRRNNNY